MRALRILTLALLWIALHLLLAGEAEAGEIVDYYGYEPIDCLARNSGGRAKTCVYPDELSERLLDGKVVAGSLVTLRIDTSPYDPPAFGDGGRSTQFLLYLYLRFPITPTRFVFGWEVSEITNGDGIPGCANSPTLPLTVQGGDTFNPIGGGSGWWVCNRAYHPHQTAFRSDLGNDWIHIAAYVGISPTSRSLVLALPVRGELRPGPLRDLLRLLQPRGGHLCLPQVLRAGPVAAQVLRGSRLVPVSAGDAAHAV
jgi:hypothetical protein